MTSKLKNHFSLGAPSFLIFLNFNMALRLWISAYPTNKKRFTETINFNINNL